MWKLYLHNIFSRLRTGSSTAFPSPQTGNVHVGFLERHVHYTGWIVSCRYHRNKKAKTSQPSCQTQYWLLVLIFNWTEIGINILLPYLTPVFLKFIALYYHLYYKKRLKEFMILNDLNHQWKAAQRTRVTLNLSILLC